MNKSKVRGSWEIEFFKALNNRSFKAKCLHEIKKLFAKVWKHLWLREGGKSWKIDEEARLDGVSIINGPVPRNIYILHDSCLSPVIGCEIRAGYDDTQVCRICE